MERKLATIRQISEVRRIPDADKICAYVVDGWTVVDSIGKYSVNDLVVYCEIDSWIPYTVAPFLTKPGKFPKEYLGVQGERLKTIRLRGQLSQGLVLPLSVVSEKTRSGDSICFYDEGDEVSGYLGIVKWEAPEEAGRAAEKKGNFPNFIRKTDEERVQNLKQEIEARKGETFEVTIKLDGSSCTTYTYGDVDGVCSRNVDLKDVDGNGFWEIAKKLALHEKIRSTGRNLAFQGELIAPNIQKNYEGVTKPEWRCFKIWDIDKQEFILPHVRRALCAELDIPHVPVVEYEFTLNHTIEELLAMAEGQGMNVPKREGLVFKQNNGQFSFKVVSNEYLLRKG